MSFYLLEAGCEELPAGFITIAENYIKEQTEKFVSLFGEDVTYKVAGTPRRLALEIMNLPLKQPDSIEEIIGPPSNIAFNPDGSVSAIGLKFAQSKGLDVESLKKVTTQKGDYLAGVKRTGGKDVTLLLEEFVVNLLKSIPFPKSMRWGDRLIRYARPLTYILSIFDGRILELKAYADEGYKSVSTVRTHRFMSPKVLSVNSIQSYEAALAENYVILTQAERIRMIKEQAARLGEAGGYTVDNDDELLSHVANLVEYPYAIEGRFDDEFLELPEHVLTTSMKFHQKYLPTYKNGKLQSIFIGVSNTKPDDPALIKEGYQRVLRARLNDAMFFFNNDKKTPLEDRLEMLKKVVYQEKLGTSYEKMLRFRELAVFLALQISPGDKELVYEAATLCKADLMCEMVYEFPELQGSMGHLYALHQGKNSLVAKAIEEHYKPRFAGDSLPEGVISKIVAASDKMDTIAGAFSIGLIPSGNEDPYALRRAAIGILNIIITSGWDISLMAFIEKAVDLVKHKTTDQSEGACRQRVENIWNFMLQRGRQLLISSYSTEADSFDAVASYFDDVADVANRAEALTAAKSDANFNDVIGSFKRLNNILKKISNVDMGEINPSLFNTNAEENLYKIYRERQPHVDKEAKEKNWSGCIQELTFFAEPLKLFFDDVMVMDNDPLIRVNRLRLLFSLRATFLTVGDLSKLL